MSRFRRDIWCPIRRSLVIKILGSRECRFVVKSDLYWNARFGNIAIACSVCFMKNKNPEREIMGQAGEIWNKVWEAVELMSLVFKSAPNSVAASLEGSQQIQAGPDRLVGKVI